MNFPSLLEEFSPLVGRVIMGTIFLMSGIDKALDFSGTTSALIALNTPFPVTLAALSIAVGVVFGINLIVGFYTRVSATVLLVFTATIAIFFHTELNYHALITSDLAMIAGLLYMMTYGSGPRAFDTHPKPKRK